MVRQFSPAKINLFFRVLSKRADGYHDIASLYQAIDLGDWLTFEWAETDRLSCSDPSLVCGEINLVWRALQLFRKYYAIAPLSIHLEKHIPQQAGLGGGSSNAATTLWTLNQLAGFPFTPSQLALMGSELGSDVPFFFSFGSAYCTGRGEIFELYDSQSIQGFLAKPDFGLSTPLVYREVRLDEVSSLDPRALLSRDPSNYCNDLECAAFRLEPRLIAFKKRLQQAFQKVVMTGSGSAFYCLHQIARFEEPVIPFRSLRRDPSMWYSA
jgi:4-diphosphocytidyl-2-C-methyl-D-erythritol kinase